MIERCPLREAPSQPHAAWSLVLNWTRDFGTCLIPQAVRREAPSRSMDGVCEAHRACVYLPLPRNQRTRSSGRVGPPSILLLVLVHSETAPGFATDGISQCLNACRTGDAPSRVPLQETHTSFTNLAERNPITDGDREVCGPDALGSRTGHGGRHGFAHIIAVGEGLVSAVVEPGHDGDAVNPQGSAFEEFRARGAVVRIDRDSERRPQTANVSEGMVRAAVADSRPFPIPMPFHKGGRHELDPGLAGHAEAGKRGALRDTRAGRRGAGNRAERCR